MPNNYIDDNYISQRARECQRLRKDYILHCLKVVLFFLLKYSNEEISDMIKPYKLIQYKNVKEIIANDDEGYKYKIVLNNIQNGKTPNRWMKNPFATENALLYLSLNHSNYKWIDCDKYKGCKFKHQFICDNHIDKGIQYNTFDNIINNHHVCKYCGYDNLSKIKISSQETIEKLCNEKDVVFYNRYSKNYESQIQYFCKKHNNEIQEMSLTHFKESKVPCRFCNVSQGELRISKYLDSQNIEYKTQYIFKECKYIKSLRFDFYLPQSNTCIEYDGQQHFKPVNFNGSQDGGLSSFIETQKRDEIKNRYCKDNNIKLIRIPYWDYENIEKTLQCKI